MLNRNDIVKEFELVVKQEIKNHNDSILATNLDINALKKSIDDLKKSLLKETAKNTSKDSTHNIEMSKITEKFDKLSIETFSKIENYKQTFVENLREFNFRLVETTDTFVTFDVVKVMRETFTSMIKDIKNGLQLLNGSIQGQFREVEKSIVKRFKSQEEDLKLLKKLVSDKEVSVLKRIDEVSVDKEGIQRELEIFKKGLYINDKQIEDIYMELDKLKKKKKK